MPDPTKAATLAASYTAEQLRDLAIQWWSSFDSHTVLSKDLTQGMWSRADHQKEATIARLNAEDFEAAFKLKEQA